MNLQPPSILGNKSLSQTIHEKIIEANLFLTLTPGFSYYGEYNHGIKIREDTTGHIPTAGVWFDNTA